MLGLEERQKQKGVRTEPADRPDTVGTPSSHLRAPTLVLSGEFKRSLLTFAQPLRKVRANTKPG